MDDPYASEAGTDGPIERVPEVPRRGFLAFATMAVGTLMGLVLAVPGLAYLASPLRRRSRDGGFVTLTRLSQLEVGVPRAFTIIEDRQDAWVKYPQEPVGSVWLIRQPAGSSQGVLALSAECPHLGCAVNRDAAGKGFLCPCHTSAFDLEGLPRNQVPPRPMDQLEVQLSPGSDPEVRVKFQRFRTQDKEKVPLA
jgi:menaquinol-cytochrome c reductase iron-sulfur subunit